MGAYNHPDGHEPRRRPARQLSPAAAALFMLAAGLAGWGTVAGGADTDLLQANSQAPYVHRISLYDETGAIIDPAGPNPPPYSPMGTCGKCHPVGMIGGGWHFNATDPDVEPGRPGEPWILTDAATGTQIPLSSRGWPGTFKPDEVGLGDFDFVLEFGRHLPGGGIGEPEDPEGRWQASGPLEIDCLNCHDMSLMHDQEERSRQGAAQNFKWSATASTTFAGVRGENRNAAPAPASDDPFAEPPDMEGQGGGAGAGGGPRVQYDADQFDGDQRVYFNLAERPSSERCYFCHTVGRPAVEEPRAWAVDTDVHLAAGLDCADCHRNGLDHMIVRGYEGEPARGRGAVEMFSCRGCHYGTAEDGKALTHGQMLGGRLGAPHPEHRGLPPIHLEKLSCTACHSGPWPGDSPDLVQTSMAHALGVAERGRPAAMPPFIQEPVYLRAENGQIMPHRMVWPSYFGRLGDGDKVTPIAPAAVREAAELEEVDALKWQPLEPAAIETILRALTEDRETTAPPVYVSAGRLWRLGEGEAAPLASAEHPAAEPYAWPLAHDVRPAAQSLGVRGCTDCHAQKSPFIFGTVTAAGMAAPTTGTQVVRAMHTFQDLDGDVHSFWGWTFTYRPVMKWVGFIAAAVLGLVLLVYLLAGLGRLLRLAGRVEP